MKGHKGLKHEITKIFLVKHLAEKETMFLWAKEVIITMHTLTVHSNKLNSSEWNRIIHITAVPATSSHFRNA